MPAYRIGKQPGNEILLRDPTVSRNHAQIVKEDNQFFLCDLKSTNGTFLNGNKVEKQRLRHNDVIRCGEQEFTFIEELPGSFILSKTDLTDSIFRQISSIQEFLGTVSDEELGTERSRQFLKHLLNSLGNDITNFQNTYRMLLTLFETAQKLNSSLDLSTVLTNLIDSALDFCNAERGFVILFNEKGDLEVTIARGMEQKDQSSLDSHHISKHIAARVADSGEALVTEDAFKDIRLSEFESIMGHKVNASIVCLPLVYKNRNIGAMYLDSSKKKVSARSRELDFLTALSNQAALAIVNAKLYQEGLKREHIQHELRLSKEIQKQILPKDFEGQFPGLDIYGLCKTAKEVGGDYYNFYQLDFQKHIIGFCIADVSGKSISAAIVAAMFHSILKAMFRTGFSIADIFDQLNNSLITDLYAGMYVTAFFGLYNSETHDLQYINAGHNPPLLYRSRSKKVEMLESKGLPVGMFESTAYEIEEIKLESDDMILLYTDGVTECSNSKKECFGEKLLKKYLHQFVGKTAKESINKLFSVLMDFKTENTEQQDDITAMMIKVRN